MKANINNDLVQKLYQNFCEAEGGVDHPVLEAWHKCEEEFGEIKFGEKTECIHNLFHETIRYVVDALQVRYVDDESQAKED